MSSPVFTEQADGAVTVDEFPSEVLVTPEFLRFASPRFVMRCGFRAFAILCANDFAAYRIVRLDKYRRVYHCRRVDP